MPRKCPTRYTIFGGKVQLFQRPRSPAWQCSATVDGKQFRSTTCERGFERAKQVAEDWYLGLRGKAHAGLLLNEKEKPSRRQRPSS
jgi:hypothetical protein